MVFNRPPKQYYLKLELSIWFKYYVDNNRILFNILINYFNKTLISIQFETLRIEGKNLQLSQFYN